MVRPSKKAPDDQSQAGLEGQHTRQVEAHQSVEELILTITGDIVSAHLSNPGNRTAITEVPEFIRSVKSELKAGLAPSAAVSGQAGEGGDQPDRPAVPVKRSVFDNEIICLNCGGKFQSLKRHIGAVHKLKPEQYREKWGLPPEYPMVCKDYAERRSDMAREQGLGSRQTPRTSS